MEFDSYSLILKSLCVNFLSEIANGIRYGVAFTPAMREAIWSIAQEGDWWRAPDPLLALSREIYESLNSVWDWDEDSVTAEAVDLDGEDSPRAVWNAWAAGLSSFFLAVAGEIDYWKTNATEN